MRYKGQSQYNALTHFQSCHYISDGNVARALCSMSYSFGLFSPGLKPENNVYVVQGSFASTHTFECLFAI